VSDMTLFRDNVVERCQVMLDMGGNRGALCLLNGKEGTGLDRKGKERKGWDYPC